MPKGAPDHSWAASATDIQAHNEMSGAASLAVSIRTFLADARSVPDHLLRRLHDTLSDLVQFSETGR